MFRELFGLPAHALVVHAAVVFIPLAGLAGILYALWPGVRKHIWWAVLGLGVLAPVTAWYARLSGVEYKQWWLDQGAGGTFIDEANNHQALGNALSWWASGLGVALLVMVLYAIRPSAAQGRGGANSPVIRILIAAVTVVLAGVTLYYAIRTGDAGARISHNEI